MQVAVCVQTDLNSMFWTVLRWFWPQYSVKPMQQLECRHELEFARQYRFAYADYLQILSKDVCCSARQYCM